MRRAFVAIPCPDPVAEALARLQADMPVARTVPRENLHLTLCFLGAVPGSTLEAVHEALSDLRQPAVEVALQGLDWLGGHSPRAVVAQVAPSPALQALQTRVTNACRNAGARIERRRFVPHVTLARLRAGAGGAALNAFVASRMGLDLGRFGACEFALLESDLRPEGAVYTALAHYPLLGRVA